MSDRGEEPGGPLPGVSQLAIWSVLGGAVVLVLGLFSVQSAYGPDTPRDYPSRTLPADVEPVLLSPPPMDDEYLPCSDCHEDEPTNRERREMEEEHDEMDFAHGDLWCLHCHDADDRDQLKLADDSRVEFEDSWKLCTQCHGKKLREWRAGVHGKRTGHWWGEKEYRSCVACHNPHSPPFEALAPKPPPRRPNGEEGGARASHPGAEASHG